MFVWGSNGVGQLSTGSCVDEHRPVLVRSLDAPPALLAAGGNHVVMVSSTGEAWVWGDGRCGQLWTPAPVAAPQETPMRAVFLELAPALPLRQLAAGWNCSVAVDANGIVWACGQFSGSAASTVPRALACDDRRVVAVACGMTHALAIADNGAVFGWGGNQHGQLGLEERVVAEPQLIPALAHVAARSVACGRRHSAVVRGDGGVVGLGCNRHGQIALSGLPQRVVPARAVRCLWDATAVLGEPDASSGLFGVWVVGKAGFGATRINESSVAGWRAVACGSEHLAALDERGAVHMYGWNEHGQLGRGDCDEEPAHGADGVVAIAARCVDVVLGGGFVLALVESE